jgi:hypothetical protein
MTSPAIRIYTAVVAVVCGIAVAWSIHQSSIAVAWQADSRSWQALAQRSVFHDRVTARRMRRLTARYNKLVVHTRRSEMHLLADIRKAQRASAAVSVPQPSVYQSAPAAAPVPVPAPAPAAPSSSPSPVP